MSQPHPQSPQPKSNLNGSAINPMINPKKPAIKPTAAPINPTINPKRPIPNPNHNGKVIIRTNAIRSVELESVRDDIEARFCACSYKNRSEFTKMRKLI